MGVLEGIDLGLWAGISGHDIGQGKQFLGGGDGHGWALQLPGFLSIKVAAQATHAVLEERRHLRRGWGVVKLIVLQKPRNHRFIFPTFKLSISLNIAEIRNHC